ncbi:hypothetical protein IJ768_03185 [Candidatus Saccharibacteria bacterium]|nr:hypothetical protein [Candidatus Saccharibacteria bacterium]
MDDLNFLKEEFEKVKVLRECALNIAEARIKNIQLTVEYDRKDKDGLKNGSPFDTVKSRLKTFDSALEKLDRRGWERSAAGFEKMKDIAGIRIVTPFLRDVYEIRDTLKAQIEKTKPKNAMRIVEVEDYILDKPKPNGYRSLHILAEVKVSAAKGDKAVWVPVEIQIRTKAQDLWASIEHKLKYKNPHPSKDTEAKLAEVANYLCGFDEMIEHLRDENDEEALGAEDIPDLSKLENFDL